MEEKTDITLKISKIKILNSEREDDDEDVLTGSGVDGVAHGFALYFPHYSPFSLLFFCYD